ncbi:hypothetical protein [Luteolibacter luteus]|uniref:Lipoprotein n=1 Tax=Luteolibacter luteus TaxID=2728835 RepID=A0A858RNG1_9BACT|nr:hypothetical protein [Luteolibacter luteus]QJE98547.1 hypothetical protein HHL09_23110 [Luteolibacter luteus]
MKSTFYLSLRSFCLPALVSLGVVSCGPSRWSESQKRSLTSVSLGTPSVASDSYKSADAVSLATQRKAGHAAAGFGLAGGLVGGLVGAAVAGSVTGVEGSNFKSNYADLLGKLDQQMKLPISTELTAAFTEVLKKDSFMASRYNPSSPNRIEVEVTAYGLRRVPGKEEDLFTPYLMTAVTLRTTDGKELLKRAPVTGMGTFQGGTGLPLHRFANDKKLMRTEWDRTIRATAASLDATLKHRQGLR